MKRILYVQSSLQGNDGASSELGAELVAELQARNPDARVTTLNLAALPLPHLDGPEFRAWSTPAAERTPEQAELAARSDRLIEQLLGHDTLVLAVPMYNMTIPSTLKAWIDRIVRAGRTFRYTEDGPRGLVEGVTAYVVFARGGMYRGTSMDTQTGYIEAILGLIGITEVNTVFAEGLAMGPTRRAQGFDEARGCITAVADQSTTQVTYGSA